MYWSVSPRSPAIDRIWFGDSDVTPEVGHRSDPVIGPDLVISIYSSASTIRLQGPLPHRKVYPTVAGARYLGIRLAPGVVKMLEAHSLKELMGSSADITRVLGMDLERLAEQLNEVTTPKESMNVVGECLLTAGSAVWTPDRRCIQALEHLRSTGGQVTVQALAQSLGVTRRQLARTFESNVGMNPKLVARLIRAEHFKKSACRQDELARQAVKFGYSDQSHLCEEIRDIYGTTPQHLLAEGR